MDHKYIEQAIEMASENVKRDGGPFAALVVRDSIVIATGTNQVTRANDPTAHAEIVAIREACHALGHFQLDDCDVYSSCEPCPMCLAALYWARPARIFYAATRDDAAAAGFDDAFIYDQLQVPGSERAIPTIRLIDERAVRPFEEWVSQPAKVRY
jgi:guanine deaminase